MKCARCSAEIPRQSQFCLRCGNPVGVNSGSGAHSATVMPVSHARPGTNRNLMIIIAVLSLALVGVLGAVIGGKLVQKPGQTDANQLVQAPNSSGPSALVQAPALSTPAPIVQAPGDTHTPAIVQAPSEPSVNTADIDDYLKFVRQIETLKQKLYHDQLADALRMMTDAEKVKDTADDSEFHNGVTDLHSNIDKLAGDWNTLTARFRERNPPSSCAELRNKYLDQLAKIQSQIVTVVGAFSDMGSDPGAALRNVTGLDTHEADRAAQAADDELASVCSKYHLSKDFSIQIDSSSLGAGLLR
jgi:hypothetical protein